MGLDDTAEGLKSLAMDMGMNLDAGGMPHRREFARISTAWKKAKAQLEVKTSTEASQRQHGERITMLPEDWTSVIVQFKKKYGADLQDEELPSQLYYEDFQDRLSAGMLRAEPQDQVISMQSETRRAPTTAFTSMPSSLSRYSSVTPKNFEELRASYEVMGNMCWLSSGSQEGQCSQTSNRRHSISF